MIGSTYIKYVRKQHTEDEKIKWHRNLGTGCNLQNCDVASKGTGWKSPARKFNIQIMTLWTKVHGALLKIQYDPVKVSS